VGGPEVEGGKMGQKSFSIYQVKDGDETWGIRFEPLERLKAAGGRVDRANYDLIYAGPLEGEWPEETILARLYAKFNFGHPMDFAGRSLSISDVVVLRHEGKVSAHYVDSGSGFAEAPEFLKGPYRYYSTQRPVDIGTFPKTANGPEYTANYPSRFLVEDGRFEAWGFLDYSAPLTEKQAEDYELRAAFDNPNLFRYPPQQLDAQLQVVGRWEADQDIPEMKRFAEWQPGIDRFKLKDSINRWPVNVRFNKIVAGQERTEKKSIADQLKESAEQATRDNAARPAPPKKTDKDRG
jgi:hypothetical protein